MINIAIIGGGASGLFAAITALSSGAQASVTVFEQLNRVGKKLLATGNGRCNITNENACEIINNKPTHYYGENSEFASYALNKFTTKSLINSSKLFSLFSIFLNSYNLTIYFTIV